LSKQILQYNLGREKMLEERLYNATTMPKKIDPSEETKNWNIPVINQLVGKAKQSYDPYFLE